MTNDSATIPKTASKPRASGAGVGVSVGVGVTSGGTITVTGCFGVGVGVKITSLVGSNGASKSDKPPCQIKLKLEKK